MRGIKLVDVRFAVLVYTRNSNYAVQVQIFQDGAKIEEFPLRGAAPRANIAGIVKENVRDKHYVLNSDPVEVTEEQLVN